MIYSVIAYMANGVTTNFNIPFSFEAEYEITVTIQNGTGSSYTIQDNVVIFTIAPTTGSVVVITRNTDIGNRDVVWQTGSILTEDDLNRAETQLFNKIQELADGLGRCAKTTLVDSINVDVVLPMPEDGKILVWSGSRGELINSTMNLVDLIAYIDSALVTLNSYVSAATDSKDAAAASAGTSGMSAANSLASATASSASASASDASRALSLLSATAAATSATTASTKATEAGQRATEASLHSTAAGINATTAVTKAAEAGLSAEQAGVHAGNSYTHSVEAEISSTNATDQATTVASLATTVANSQAALNALLGMGLGTATVDNNGDLSFTYSVGTITGLTIDATGSLILTY